MKPATEGPGICSSVFTCRDAGTGMTSAQRSMHLSRGNALLPDIFRAWGSILLNKFIQCARTDAAAHPTLAPVLYLCRTSARLPRTPFFGSANGVRRARTACPLIWEMDVVWSFIMWYAEISHTALQDSSSSGRSVDEPIYWWVMT